MTNDHSSTQRQSRYHAALRVVACILAANTTAGFSPASLQRISTVTFASTDSTTRHYFQNDQVLTPEPSPEAFSSFLPTSASPQPSVLSLYRPPPPPATEQQNSASAAELPTWLSLPRSHMADTNAQKLYMAMRTSFFTENETLKLLKAIEEASEGDAQKAAGAAEFCLIMVETMEMGLNALTAAAFHYCSCVKARHLQSLSYETSPRTSHYGDHAVNIARDAARLKRLEMVAATVTSNTDQARVSPDSQDAENLRKLLLSETKDWRALAIRSAACLYRLRGLLETLAARDLTPEAVRVCREALYIYAPLASRLGMHRLKNELEAAAFSILYRRQYETVKALQDEDGNDMSESMTEALAKVQADMTATLENDAEFSSLVEDFSITARVKESYSMWRKMLRLGYKTILEVPDALALRIVLNAKQLSPDEPAEVTRARERALCYYAQKLCLDRYQVAENPRFKDYIEQPKPNGYQSLHYTAQTSVDDQQWTIEIQVRSGEMHNVAEYGLASHWDYKAQKKSPSSGEVSSSDCSESTDDNDQSSDAYLRSVQEWHWQQHGQKVAADASPASSEPVILSDIWQSRVRADRIRDRTQRLEPYIQALTAAQSDLARESVFVFLTKSQDQRPSEGKVLALPAGACVLDALREGAKEYGMQLLDSNLALNGAATSVTRRLNNGDVLTAPVQVPSTATLRP